MVLTNADVQKQIKQMMAFIDQEANEKSEEIDAKAEEEFNIEKGRLVQQQRLKIMEYYEKKEKQVELQKKIQSSNMLNHARLQVLKAREEHVRNVLDEAQRRLGQIPRDPQRYLGLVQNLITQGLTQLLEANVVLQCRQVDLSLVNDVLAAALDEYTKITKKECKVIVDNENFLPAETAGGIVLLSHRGKIRISNTLEARLKLMSEQMTPEIRNALFGRNPNRKFAD